MNIKKYILFICIVFLISFVTSAQQKPDSSIIRNDSIDRGQKSFTNNMVVGVDQFGRSFNTISYYKPDKKVGLFFWLWIGQPYATGIYDATKITQMPNGVNLLYNFNYLNEKISPNLQAHFWGEPLWGYYNSDDEWVIRHQIQMLTIAGIDFIVFDATNYRTYKNVYIKILKVINEYIGRGWDPPKIAFYTHSRSIQTVKKLYKELYKPDLYPKTWYRIHGKPFIIGYTKVENDLKEAGTRGDTSYMPTPLSDRILHFFYFKRPQWPSDPEVYKNGFPWIEWTYPQPLHGNTMNVTVASHPNIPMSRSITHGVVNWGRGWNPKLKKNIGDDVDKGTFFQLEWDHAIKVNPDIIFVGGWNEWIAYKQPWNGEYMLCDAANKEYSRDIEPMKGGYEDAFYLQLIRNVRKYKGVREPIPTGTIKTINISAGMDQWRDVKNVYVSIDPDMPQRDSYGASKAVRYFQPPPRNKLQEIRVCNDGSNIYLYIRCKNNITKDDGKGNWMNLFIGTGDPGPKAWQCYDYIIGQTYKNGRVSIGKLNADFTAPVIGYADYTVTGNIMQVKIPRKTIGLKYRTDKFYFKVADDIEHPSDLMSYYISGSSMPMGRLSYMYSIR